MGRWGPWAPWANEAHEAHGAHRARFSSGAWPRAQIWPWAHFGPIVALFCVGDSCRCLRLFVDGRTMRSMLRMNVAGACRGCMLQINHIAPIKNRQWGQQQWDQTKDHRSQVGLAQAQMGLGLVQAQVGPGPGPGTWPGPGPKFCPGPNLALGQILALGQAQMRLGLSVFP